MNLSPNQKQNHFGFTLVELLFVIAIITVLSTMALGVMKSAQDDAKEAATEARIRQIEAILQIELEDYEVRRLPVSVGLLATYARAFPLYGTSANPMKVSLQVRNLKRRIIQDIINAEMPRPVVNPVRNPDGSLNFDWNPDIGFFPTNSVPATDPVNPMDPARIGFDQWLRNGYPAALRNTLEASTSAKVRSWSAFRRTLISNGTEDEFDLPGEYLYEILKRIDLDGAPAIETLRNQAIGDSDSDGFMEVVDAFGEPMQLRIWQIDADEINPDESRVSPQNPNPRTDIWRDVPAVDFEDRDPDGVPTGYSGINPTEPRETNKIRFEVVSTRLVY